MSIKDQQELAQLRYLANSFDCLRLKAWTDWLGQHDSEAVEFITHCLLNLRQSSSQIFQDLFVDFVLGKTNGIFIEFGATDGRLRSNSWFLEQYRDWTGLLAEPAKAWHAQLGQNRPNCTIDTRCVWKETGHELIFRQTADTELSTIEQFAAIDKHQESRDKISDQYPVSTVSLNDLCIEYLGDRQLDYLSVDTEGSEFEILSAFELTKFRPQVVTVEHNHAPQRQDIFDIFNSSGYLRIFPHMSTIDDWYVERNAWAKLQARLANQA